MTTTEFNSQMYRHICQNSSCPDYKASFSNVHRNATVQNMFSDNRGIKKDKENPESAYGDLGVYF